MNYTTDITANVQVNYTSMSTDELLERCEALFASVDQVINELHLLHEEIRKRVA
jgi:hypothetical protein